MEESVLTDGQKPDVNENDILRADVELLSILLQDQSSKKNILWMTDNYVKHGLGFRETSEIQIPSITGKYHNIIKPRVNKSKQEQLVRVRDKAEVFTPSWICNKQNNLVDDAWFGYSGSFNKEKECGWETVYEAVKFPEGKTWQGYVLSPRLEISCGEAPYLVSRYDTTNGEMIPVKDRIGLLDRKLRIVSENTDTQEEWIEWATKAVQSTYGYEWQGDNLLLARENIILTFIDYYKVKFNGNPKKETLREIATVVSWNLWQMDGLKFVIPMSCHEESIEQSLFDFGEELKARCEGCDEQDPLKAIGKHNGIKCKIKDWQANKVVTAVSLLKGNR